MSNNVLSFDIHRTKGQEVAVKDRTTEHHPALASGREQRVVDAVVAAYLNEISRPTGSSARAQSGYSSLRSMLVSADGTFGVRLSRKE
jgi:hypothetical protein